MVNIQRCNICIVFKLLNLVMTTYIIYIFTFYVEDLKTSTSIFKMLIFYKYVSIHFMFKL